MVKKKWWKNNGEKIFEELKNNSSRFTSKTYSDKIYDEGGIEYIVPGKIILNSK